MLDPIGRIHGLDPKRRHEIRILYGEPQAGLGNLLRTCLKREGFSRILGFTSLPPIEKAVAAFDPDLLLIDAGLSGGSPVQLVRDIREGRIGHNPFLATIITAWRPSLAFTSAVADCGCDDLLAKPLSPDQILERIGALVYNRKPFIVTSDYIGPVRHADDEPNAPRLSVPNSLREKIADAPTHPAAIGDRFDGAMRALTEQRLRSHGDTIVRLVAEILPAYRKGYASAATARSLDRLLSRAEDAQQRLSGTPYAPIGTLCATLRHVAQAILRDHPAPGDKELEILPRLAEAIMAGFSDAQSAASVGGEISSTVGRYLDVRSA